MNLTVAGRPADDFPDPGQIAPAPQDYPIASGGDLSLRTLLKAYSKGIFPWFAHDPLIYWWSPHPRLVLFPDDFAVSRSLRKSIRNRGYVVTLNQNFEQVIASCSQRPPREVRELPAKKESQPLAGSNLDKTWITPGMIKAYTELHRHGYAHSIETWLDGELVGGLYGVSLGTVFFGESMFSTRTDASKVALNHLVQHLKFWNFSVIDCQVESELLLSLGAVFISRKQFTDLVTASVCATQPDGVWAHLCRLD